MSDAVSRRMAQQVMEHLKKATAEFNQYQRELDDLVMEAPSGLPFSDGQMRIVQTGQQLKVAFENYQKAIKQYRDFVIDGIVPDVPKPNRD